MNFVHKKVPLKIWADIDEGIVDFVRKLNTIPGVRILDSDQGDLLQGGVRYAWVNVSWPDEDIRDAFLIPEEFELESMDTLARQSEVKIEGALKYVPPGPKKTRTQAEIAQIRENIDQLYNASANFQEFGSQIEEIKKDTEILKGLVVPQEDYYAPGKWKLSNKISYWDLIMNRVV
jgi:hypothetical protein